MTPVDMTIIHDPENGKIGDCFRASIASLLDLSPEEVPHFMDYDWNDTDSGKWYPALLEWLKPRGLTYFELPIPAELHGTWFDGLASCGFDAHHLLSGMSPRATHTVVARNGKMVHDPSKQRTGLVGPYTDGDHPGCYLYSFLIKTCSHDTAQEQRK